MRASGVTGTAVSTRQNPFRDAQLGSTARDGSSSNPDDASNQRYVERQRLYVQRCDPENGATIVIDYNDLSKPKIVPAKVVSPLPH
jgi:hypothetical protein